MNRRLILSGIFLTFLISSITSQYATKMYEFPQYGFKIPFYTDAKVKTVNKGTANELIQYEHLVEKNNTILYASLRILQKQDVTEQIVYMLSERYVKQYHKILIFQDSELRRQHIPPGVVGFYCHCNVVDKNNSNITKFTEITRLQQWQGGV
jgi:hypothetical protein